MALDLVLETTRRHSPAPLVDFVEPAADAAAAVAVPPSWLAAVDPTPVPRSAVLLADVVLAELAATKASRSGGTFQLVPMDEVEPSIAGFMDIMRREYLGSSEHMTAMTATQTLKTTTT